MRAPLRYGLLALAVVVQATGASARRPEPTPAAIRDATRLWERARSLRELQLPLLERRAARGIAGALGELERSGIKVDRRTPIVFDSSRELEATRGASELLRGARPGTPAYELRKHAVLRTRELQRTIYGLPRQMNAYTNAAKGSVELAINLDNPFYAKPAELLTVLAHEHRHIRDANRALRIERLLAEEKNAGPRREQKLRGIVERLWNRPRAETRAFEAQAYALAATGRSLGIWWRAPAGGPVDQAYPPAALNRALLRGYFKGLGEQLGPAMKDASRKGRALGAGYLAGYKAVLKEQANAFHQALRKDAERDPAAIERYNARKAEVFAKAGKPVSRLTLKRAYLIGQADAYAGNAPIPRARELIAR